MKNYKKKSDRKSDTSTLKEAIDAMIDTYKLKGKFSEKKLISSWESMMGKPIANRTEKIYFNNSVLFVKLNSAPLRQELNMSKAKVLEIIYKDYGKTLVTDIIFY